MKKPTSVKALLSLVLLATASMFSCKGSPTSSAPAQPVVPSYFSVEGTVFYSTTPISDISVVVHMWNGAATDLTDLETKTVAGYYRFASVKEGWYWIRTAAPGYVGWPNLEAVGVKVDGNIKKDLYLARPIQLLDPPSMATVNTSHPILVWRKLDEAVSYTVSISGSGTAENYRENIEGIAGTSYTVITELWNWVTYSWHVRGYNRQGTLVGSNEWGFSFKVSLPK